MGLKSLRVWLRLKTRLLCWAVGTKYGDDEETISRAWNMLAKVSQWEREREAGKRRRMKRVGAGGGEGMGGWVVRDHKGTATLQMKGHCPLSQRSHRHVLHSTYTHAFLDQSLQSNIDYSFFVWTALISPQPYTWRLFLSSPPSLNKIKCLPT